MRSAVFLTRGKKRPYVVIVITALQQEADSAFNRPPLPTAHQILQIAEIRRPVGFGKSLSDQFVRKAFRKERLTDFASPPPGKGNLIVHESAAIAPRVDIPLIMQTGNQGIGKRHRHPPLEEFFADLAIAVFGRGTIAGSLIAGFLHGAFSVFHRYQAVSAPHSRSGA